jgi:hypothetical protein
VQAQIFVPKYRNRTQLQLPTTYRVVNAADIVPHLPPRLLYWQTDFEIWYPTGNMTTADFVVCPEADPRSQCSNALGKFKVADHLIYYNQVVNSTEWINDGCVVPKIAQLRRTSMT